MLKFVMNLFINFVTAKEEILDFDNLEVISLKNLKNVRRVIVVNYPGSYTGIRKAISIAKAIFVCFENVELLGFSVFDYLNSISEKNFFIDKHMFWTDIKKSSEINQNFFPITELLNHFKESNYISNEQTEISQKVDCSSKKLIEFIKVNNCLNPLTQIYNDKFIHFG